MSQRAILTATTVLLFTGVLVGCGALDESAERFASTSAEGISSVRIIAEAGDLEVIGEVDLTDVNASGTAYASTTARLDEVQFVVRVSGSEMVT